MTSGHAPPFAVRHARDADAPVMLSVIHAAFEEQRGRIDPPSSALDKTLEDLRGELAVSTGFVADSGDAVVGCVLAREVDGALYWDRLAVAPARRGEGVARALVDAVEDLARARDIERLTLSVRLALAENHGFYERLGYRRTGLGRHPCHHEPTFAVMEKRLTRVR